MRIRSLTWESSIPKWDSAAREETTELLMDEEAFARFYRSTERPLQIASTLTELVSGSIRMKRAWHWSNIHAA